MAIALMGESGTNYDSLQVEITNQLLAEMFSVNNTTLTTPLTTIPSVTLATDTLTYDTGLLREVMPYGMAAKLSLQDSPTLFNAMNYEYENRLQKYSRGVTTTITDYYGGDTDEALPV